MLVIRRRLPICGSELLILPSWIHSTYSVFGMPHDGMPHDGIAAKSDSLEKPILDDGHDIQVRHHTYYQWVCFCLFFQALLFSLPRFLW